MPSPSYCPIVAAFGLPLIGLRADLAGSSGVNYLIAVVGGVIVCRRPCTPGASSRPPRRSPRTVRHDGPDDHQPVLVGAGPAAALAAGGPEAAEGAATGGGGSGGGPSAAAGPSSPTSPWATAARKAEV